MNVYLNSIQGIPDALTSLLMSKRSWTREKESQIRYLCSQVLNSDGFIRDDIADKYAHDTQYQEVVDEWRKKMEALCKWGTTHITLLKFIDLSFTVEGLHRAGQDDWDSHAKRFDNRIIRSSTRLATFDAEMSDFYKGKIIPTDEMLSRLNIDLPEKVPADDYTYVKTINGYIREDLKDDKDVRRGLYMLSIPSNFIYKVNLTEFSHVYKERNKDGGANPEVKELCERSCDLLQGAIPYFTRDLLAAIKN